MNEQYGLTGQQISLIQNILNQYLKPRPFHIFVFGSRAKGTHRQYSDLDLWIESKPELTQSQISELNRIFEDSDLPIKIDIVNSDTCIEEYKKRILTERVLWY